MSEHTEQPIIEPSAAVHLLADHLDAVLAAGEDMLKLEVKLDTAKSDGVLEPWAGLGLLVAEVRQLELSLIARALQARNRTRDLVREPGKQDTLIRSLLSLYVASTAVLVDAAQELSDNTFADFESGIDPLAYLRTRNVVPPDAATLRKGGTLSIGEDFLVAKKVALGPLLDVAAQLLDLLEATYGLFSGDDDDGSVATDVNDKSVASGDEGEPPVAGHG